MATAVARWAGRRALAGFLVAAPVGLIASLLSAGQRGVHRWVDIGPAHMNVAEVLIPPMVVAVSARASPWSWLCALAVAVALVAQPDASQTTAFAFAAAAMVGLTPGRVAFRAASLALIALAVATAWWRPDPLAPVPEVEGVMVMAAGLSPLAALGAWGALLGAAVAPALANRSAHREVRIASISLVAYAIASATAPLLGAFPVPLVGMGMSPILGSWLAIGLLAALERRASTGAEP